MLAIRTIEPSRMTSYRRRRCRRSCRGKRVPEPRRCSLMRVGRTVGLLGAFPYPSLAMHDPFCAFGLHVPVGRTSESRTMSIMWSSAFCLLSILSRLKSAYGTGMNCAWPPCQLPLWCVRTCEAMVRAAHVHKIDDGPQVRTSSGSRTRRPASACWCSGTPVPCPVRAKWPRRERGRQSGCMKLARVCT